MKATTIKLENPLLNELNGVRPSQKSLSAFVKEILEQDIRRRKMREAARKYQEFLTANPEEKSWLEEWESVDLTRPPQSKKRKKKP